MNYLLIGLLLGGIFGSSETFAQARQIMDFDVTKSIESKPTKFNTTDVFGSLKLWEDYYKIEFLFKAKTSVYAAANGTGTHVFGTVKEPKCSVWYEPMMIKKQPRLLSIENQFVEALGSPNGQQLIVLHEVGHCVISFSALPSLDEDLRRIWGTRYHQELFADIYALYSYSFLYGKEDVGLFNLVKFNIEKMRRSETIEYYENSSFIKKVSFRKSNSIKEVCENTWFEIGQILNNDKIAGKQLHC